MNARCDSVPLVTGEAAPVSCAPPSPVAVDGDVALWEAEIRLVEPALTRTAATLVRAGYDVDGPDAASLDGDRLSATLTARPPYGRAAKIVVELATADPHGLTIAVRAAGVDEGFLLPWPVACGAGSSHAEAAARLDASLARAASSLISGL